MIKDVAVAAEYDRALADGERSKVVNAKFKINKDGGAEFSRPSDLLMERERFDGLIARCVKTADVAADEIASGYIARAPIEGACDKCAYRGVCGGTAAVRNSDADDGLAEDE